MDFVVIMYHNFSFAKKYRDESRCDYIIRVIKEAKEKVAKHHPDVVKISGEMFSNDIKYFKKILNVEPKSKEPINDSKKYAVTFEIPASCFDLESPS